MSRDGRRRRRRRRRGGRQHRVSPGRGGRRARRAAGARGCASATGSTGACAGGFRHQFSSRDQHRAVARERADDPRVHAGARAAARRRAGRVPVPRPRRARLGRVPRRARSSSARSGSTRSCSRRTRPADDRAGHRDRGRRGRDVLPDDGIADPSGLTQGYATLARRAGAELRLGVEVVGIEADGDAGAPGSAPSTGVDRHPSW